MAKFSPVVRSARFVYSPYTPEQMYGLGEAFRAAQDEALAAGLNVYDVPAAPLKRRASGKPGYPESKLRKGLKPIRDWFWRGRTRRSIKTLQANENRVVIGATDAEADRIIRFNNRRERQFGMSPRRMQAVMDYVRRLKFVTTKSTAA